MGPLPWHEVYTLVHTFFSNVVIFLDTLHIVIWINQILGVGQFMGKKGVTLTVCI